MLLVEEADDTNMIDRLKAIIGLVASKLGRGKTIGILVLLLAGGFWYWRSSAGRSQKPQYQTANVERGTLVTTVSASGNVVGGSSQQITTAATGTVSNVYVKNGDKVTEGQKIAEIVLDGNGIQRQAAAWSSYLSAKNQLEATKANINSLQAAEFKANQTFINDAVARGLVTSDPTYIQENANWLQAEANYQNQTGVITQAQAALMSTWYTYQQSSSVVLAPVSGVVTDLAIAPGVPLTLSGTSSNTGTSNSQKIGTISSPGGKIVVTVNVAEIDSPKVSPGQKATLILDAFADKTFTGKVLTVDTSGAVSSGVTTYPATIVMDTSDGKIYPNMAVDAKIITNVEDNVILVPSGAIQTSGGQSTVRVLRNGQVMVVTVAVGDVNDSQTVVLSGLSEGETVVTGVAGGTSAQSQSGGSPFGAFGGNRGFGGGGAVFRMQGR